MNNQKTISNPLLYVLINGLVIFTMLFSPRGDQLGLQYFSDVAQWIVPAATYLTYVWWVFTAILTLNVAILLFTVMKVIKDPTFLLAVVISNYHESGQTPKHTWGMLFTEIIGSLIVGLSVMSGFYFYAIIFGIAIFCNGWLNRKMEGAGMVAELLGLYELPSQFEA